MTIVLRDLYYEDNKSEVRINIKNKEFGGEIYKAIFEVKLKFGIQC